MPDEHRLSISMDILSEVNTFGLFSKLRLMIKTSLLTGVCKY